MKKVTVKAIMCLVWGSVRLSLVSCLIIFQRMFILFPVSLFHVQNVYLVSICVYTSLWYLRYVWKTILKKKRKKESGKENWCLRWCYCHFILNYASSFRKNIYFKDREKSIKCEKYCMLLTMKGYRWVP